MNKNYIREKVIDLIREAGFFIEYDTDKVHLFNDIAIDSLAFITLLIRIEENFSFKFDITQMEDCAQLDYLLELIDKKCKERNSD